MPGTSAVGRAVVTARPLSRPDAISGTTPTTEEGHLNVAGNQVSCRSTAALVRHPHRFDARHGIEEFSRQVHKNVVSRHPSQRTPDKRLAALRYFTYGIYQGGLIATHISLARAIFGTHLRLPHQLRVPVW